MNKNFLYTFLFIAVFFFGAYINVYAAPQTVGYEGFITDTGGAAQTGTFDMRIRVYDALSAGTLLYDETHTGVSVSNGYFGLSIGAGTVNGGTVASLNQLPFDQQYFLSLEVLTLGTGEMSPRTPINAVPYAYTAYGLITSPTNPLNPISGKIYFNTTDNTTYIYNGAVWNPVATGGGLTSLNGQTGVSQSFASSATGTDFSISSSGNVHSFNLPNSSAASRGLLSAPDWSVFNGKQDALGYTPLDPANNLSDLLSASTARTNLGLGTLATQSGTFSGTSSGTNTGDQTTITGNAATATALETARTIGGISFDGTGDITVASATGGFAISGGDLALNANNITMTGSLGTTGARLAKGWFTNLQVTNPIIGSITGNAGTVSTNANLTGPITSLGNATSVTSQTGIGSTFVMNTSPTLVTPTLGEAVATSLNNLTITAPITSATLTIDDGFTLHATGDVDALSGSHTGTSSGTNTGDQTNILGNAATATALETPRLINGVSFNGTADITVSAAAGTLTGTTLASNVINSSLTSVGTLGSLVLSGAVTGATGYNGLVITPNTGVITSGTWNGTAIAVTRGGTGTANGSITGTGALSFTSSATNPLTLDSGTTGDINIGVNANAKIINLGTGGIAVKTIHIGDGAVANAVTVGSTTGGATTTIQGGSGNVNMQVAGAGTTGNVQVGAGGAGSATPDLLVLDLKNTSGDPTGTNGAMYYNSNINTFRCFQNGAWSNCINGDRQLIPKTTDQSVTSSTTLTNDTALTFPVASGETWVFNFFLFVTNANSAQPDFQAAILGASGWTCSAQLSGSESLGAAFRQAATTDCDNAPAAMVNNSIAADASNGFNARIQGFITTTSAGSVTLQFAQNTSSASALTIKGGSYVQAFKVGGADLAEMYYGKESYSSGTVVSIDPNLSAGVIKSAGINDKNVLGIVTTQPGMVLGSPGASSGIPILVALSGRVPVNVSTENGDIAIGDYLTPSSIPGVAAKSNGSGSVIGQAMSGYDGQDIGMVIAFVKNFDFGASNLLLGDVSSSLNADGSNGLLSLVATIQSENAKDPVGIIGQKIADGARFLTNFISARVTAIRGYFDEIFANTSHQKTLCVGDLNDGGETCITKTQIDQLFQSQSVGGSSSITTPASVPDVTPTPNPTPDLAPVPATDSISDAISTPEATPAPDSDTTSTPDVTISPESDFTP